MYVLKRTVRGELVGLRHECQKQTHCSTGWISKEMDPTRYSIVQIIHCICCL